VLTPVTLVTWEGEIGKNHNSRSTLVNSEIPFQPIKAVVMVHAYHPMYMGSVNRRVMVQASLDVFKK
jgi:hypothetical protein